MPKFLQQLQALWTSLSSWQKITVLAAAAAVAAGLWALQKWSVDHDFRPLYTDMTNEEAAAVVARLRELGVPYRLNEAGSTVRVPSARLAETRLQLATSGLPRNGRMGFELFDQTKFGATEFAEQVNYRRALEGELERSVMSLNQLEQARVHVSLPKESVFLDHQQPAKASVVVKVRRSRRLEPEHVRGIAYLVASAVEGLSPEKVAVIDVGGALLSRPRAGDSSEEELALEQKVERDIAQKIVHTLEPYLGAGKARTSVSAEVQLNAGEQTEEVLDPNPVMLTSQKSEEQSQPAWSAGPPGTASNVPRGAGRPAGGGNTLNRRQEVSTYQVSKTVTRMHLEKGGIKRLSVAVLVDHKAVTDSAGRRLEPRTPQEMKTIRDLVVAAAGILESRGDLLTIENLPFEAPEPIEPPAATPPPPPAKWWEPLRPILSKEWWQRNRYVGMGIAVGILLAVGGFLVWRRGTVKRPRPQGPPAGLPSPATEIEKQLVERQKAQREAEEALMLELKMPQMSSNKALVLKKIVSDGAKKDPAAAAQLIRTWIHQDND